MIPIYLASASEASLSPRTELFNHLLALKPHITIFPVSVAASGFMLKLQREKCRMSKSCCNTKPEPTVSEPVSSCCAKGQDKKSTDWLLVISTSGVALLLLLSFAAPDIGYRWYKDMVFGVQELMGRMWWGLILAAVFVGLLERIPQDIVLGVMGTGKGARGIVRATLAGVLLDLCSHGILMVGMKLYQRGASIGQVYAFLLASPWNSLSLTIILVSLVGISWTLIFIVLSMLVGISVGVLAEYLVSQKRMPANPNSVALPEGFRLGPALREQWQSLTWSPAGLLDILVDGVKGSTMVLRWVFFGVLLAVAIRTFMPITLFETWFGPTLLGLGMTVIAATIIEVCSEGSTPIAADLLTRARAPGNSFTFLMSGVSTDYTEIMSIRDTSRSWKLALFLPLLTVPQVMLAGLLLNMYG
jgi:uncharacterized membrane protein YraQ (UPF0718 family)